MIKFVFILTLSFISYFSFSQTTVTIPKPAQTELADNDNTIYTDVDSVASFPGGKKEWIKFIQNNLDANVGVENGAKKGTYHVKIKFTVTKDGTLKDFIPVTKYKHGFEEEAIRVLKLSPKWIPARKNGKPVNSITEQAQTFVIIVG